MRRNGTGEGTLKDALTAHAGRAHLGRPISRARKASSLYRCVIITCCTLVLWGCGALGLGKFKWIERTAGDERYFLLKECFLAAGGPSATKTSFDPALNPVVNLWFTLRNETNKYVAESRWIDPAGQEYRTIRTTHDIQVEGKRNIDRRNEFGGTARVHTISTQELHDHKRGLWKVALYIDGQLARRLEFSVR